MTTIAITGPCSIDGFVYDRNMIEMLVRNAPDVHIAEEVRWSTDVVYASSAVISGKTQSTKATRAVRNAISVLPYAQLFNTLKGQIPLAQFTERCDPVSQQNRFYRSLDRCSIVGWKHDLPSEGNWSWLPRFFTRRFSQLRFLCAVPVRVGFEDSWDVGFIAKTLVSPRRGQLFLTAQTSAANSTGDLMDVIQRIEAANTVGGMIEAPLQMETTRDEITPGVIDTVMGGGEATITMPMNNSVVFATKKFRKLDW